MEERFDLSWVNKEVRMWSYIMIPLMIAGLVWIVFSDSSASSFAPLIPAFGWIIYGVWRYFFKKSQKC